MNKEDLAEYLEKYIKPELVNYAKENNTTVEKILEEVLKQNELHKKKNNNRKK